MIALVIMLRVSLHSLFLYAYEKDCPMFIYHVYAVGRQCNGGRQCGHFVI